MNITKPKNRKAKKELHSRLVRSDSSIINIKNDLRSIERHFKLKRDIETLKMIVDKLDWCNNKLLLLEGRIISEIGSRIYFENQRYLQFMYKRHPKKAGYGKRKIIPLIDTDYVGKKFEFFMKNDVGAKAEVIKDKEKYLILGIFIPLKYKKEIRY